MATREGGPTEAEPNGAAHAAAQPSTAWESPAMRWLATYSLAAECQLISLTGMAAGHGR